VPFAREGVGTISHNWWWEAYGALLRLLIVVCGGGEVVEEVVLSLFFYARNLGYGVRFSGLCAYVGTCVSIVG